MMEAVIFLLKSSFCSAVLLTYYVFFLRKRSLNRYNRFYLLLSIIASIGLPLLHVEWAASSTPDAGVALYKLLAVINGGGAEEAVRKENTATLSPFVMAAGVYSAVCLLLLVLMLAKVAKVFRLKRRYTSVPHDDYHFISTPLESAPFSFLNLLFWRSDIDLSSPYGQRILRHELTHIRERHTLDKLLAHMATSALWLNPFLWILQKELSLVHEFIADEEAVKDRDTETFALMLLQTHYGKQLTTIVHPFFHSSIKRRLTMLQKNNTPSYVALRRFMAVPLLAASTLLISFEKKDAAVVKAKEKIILALDAGHGGEDKGATGINGVLEKDLNLKVVNKLAALSGDYNIHTIKVRAADNYPTLLERPAIAENEGADLFISIHINKDVNGIGVNEMPYEMIIDERNPRYEESRTLASAIAPRLGNAQAPSRLLQKHLAVLGNASMPAVLLELGNIANPRQVEALQDDEQLEQLCRNILGGVVAYHNSK